MNNLRVIDFRRGGIIMAMSICKVCGKRFNQYRSFQIYCSDACRNQVLGRTRSYKKTKTITKKCEECGKEFETNLKHKVFCSNECYLAAKEKYYVPNSPHKVMCGICGKEFETTHHAKKYCSKTCYDEAAQRRRNERILNS